jgi:protocatechuate 3,4-dioxygenase beta subunit
MWAVSEPVEVRELGEVYDVVLTIRPVALEDMIRLTVVDPDGKPVPEARITYTAQRGGSSWSGSTQADDKGQYTHRLSVRTPHDFGASDPEQRFGAAQAKAVQPGTLDLVLQLTVRRVIAIEVVDEKGEPVKKYSVELREVRERGRPLSEYGDGDEHEGGRVELALPAAPFEIVVDALGYEVATLGPYDPASAPSEVRAELQSLPGVRGVVTAGGKPVSGAEVSAHAFVAADHELVVNGFRSRTRMDGESSAKTDEHGEFVLTPRKDDRYVVRAELDGWAPGESEPFDLDASAGASGIAIELVRGGAVEGHAAPGPGEGLAGLIVGASRGDGRGVTTRTDAEGKFRFDGLTPGRWWVGRHDQEISPNSTSSSSGNTTRRDEIEWNCVVRDGETTRVDVPAPAQDSVVLRGQLAFGGAAAAGWKATLHAQGVIGVPPREAQLDERGRFEVTAKEAGDYYLIVSPGSTHGSDVRVTQRVSLVDGANSWELDVPVGRIDGRVASAASDESEQYVWNWRRENGLSVQGSLDPAPDGSFAIERAPAGTIKFSAWPNEGKARELKSVELAAGASLRVEL